jgi:hypothetical protein
MRHSKSRRLPRPLACSLVLAVLLSACGPFSSSLSHRIDISGSGSGTASGTWTDHFIASRAPWSLLFRIDCSGASSHWNVDLTLEKMYQNDYYQPVPIHVGWSQRTGPIRASVTRRVAVSGEFWFIVYADSGCTWRIMVPA